jgi:HAE1 family hydrophobic/amphiphilic exporter-1
VRITDACIRRPVFASVLVGAVVVLGLVSLPRLGVDLFPNVDLPMVTVAIVLPGASPETVEREVTEPIEEAISMLDGIRALRSSSSDSLSRLFIEFQHEEDAHEKVQAVRDRVFASLNDLPPDAEPPVVERVDPAAAPILSVMLAGTLPIRELTELADKQLKPRLQRVSGVGSVSLVGGREREIRIWIDPVRLSGYALSIDDVVASIRRSHVEGAAGRIEGRQREYTVKARAKFTTIDQFRDLIVYEEGGRLVRLRDVATVEDGMADERTVARLDGQRGVALEVRRRAGENTVAVVAGLRAALEDVRKTLPPGVRLVTARDSAQFIQSSIADVGVDMAWGSLLAVVVVLLFLRNGRSTLIAATAIPASVIASFSLLYFLDITLNLMTLMALSLSIGMLVDDAIVVIERIHRRMEDGEDAMVAASAATEDVGPAVVSTTLAVCAVFVPIAFLSGTIGQFFREFGLVATSAVSASLLVALTTTPMLAARFLRISSAPSRASKALDDAYRRLERAYRRLLVWGLSHRWAVLGLLLVSVQLGMLLAARIPFDFVVSADRGEFIVRIKLPPGTPMPGTVSALAQVEGVIRSHPEVRAVFSTIGGDLERRVHEGLIHVSLFGKQERELGQHELMDQLRGEIASLPIPFEERSVEDIPTLNVAGQRYAPLMFAIRGPDRSRVALMAGRVVAEMRADPLFSDVTSSHEPGDPEIALDVDRGTAGDLGIHADRILETLAGLMTGLEVTSFEQDGERYPVRVQMAPEYREDVAKLGLIRVRAPSGELVPLGNLVAERPGTGEVRVQREDRTPAIIVFAGLSGAALGSAVETVQRIADEAGVSGEYDLVPIGSAQQMEETAAAVGFAFLLALIALYMILAAQFDSFVRPIVILLSAPLSFAGAFAAMYAFGFNLDMMAQIGFLMLIGLVMKNGILLVDYTNQLQKQGAGLREAVLEAGPARLRPVLMTAISTVFGMLPVALGSGDGAEWRARMGAIAIGGMASSTLLTLLVVPVAYTLVEQARAGLFAGITRLADRIRTPWRHRKDSRTWWKPSGPDRTTLEPPPPAGRPRRPLDGAPHEPKSVHVLP